ncbi:MAG: hypothetical protein ACI4QT_07005, partial [Kiritimatiellia bacterium]
MNNQIASRHIPVSLLAALLLGVSVNALSAQDTAPSAKTAREQALESIKLLPDDTVYGRVWNVLAPMDNRRVGTENLDKAFAVVSNELAAAGLQPQIQTFDSLSQVTERLSLTYQGQKVAGALMIDNGPATFVLDEPIVGNAIYVGNGRLQDFEGKNLNGCIAILDANLPRAAIADVMTHGAKAIVLVGDSSLSNWNLSDVGFTAVTLIPRVFIDRKDAERAGLLRADGTKEMVLDARAVIRDVPGKNLWVELPHKKGWTGNLEAEEILLLSATIDTYGFTPDYSPDRRRAANVALLTDVAATLARSGDLLNRRVVVVFFGSCYAGQEGARFFYHAIDMADKNVNNLDLEKRGLEYDKELAEVCELIAFAKQNNIIDAQGHLARALQIRLKRELVSFSNALRTPIGNLRERKKALETALSDAKSDAEKTTIGKQIAEVDAQLKNAEAEREATNLLREQLVKKRYNPDAGAESNPQADVAAMYDRMTKVALDRLYTRQTELENMV